MEDTYIATIVVRTRQTYTCEIRATSLRRRSRGPSFRAILIAATTFELIQGSSIHSRSSEPGIATFQIVRVKAMLSE